MENKINYRKLGLDKELGITDVRQLTVGNVVSAKVDNKYYICVVTGLSTDKVHLKKIHRNDTIDEGEGIHVSTKLLHKVVYPLELTDEFFIELGFEKEVDNGLTMELIETEFRYTHPDNVYTILATKFNSHILVSDGYRIHVDDCDMDTMCGLSEVKHCHKLQNFLMVNGIDLFNPLEG